jgi:catechol 2,3-dioxygenase
MTSLDPTVSPVSAERQSSTAHGGSTADTVLANAPHRIGRVALSVRDLDRVSRFYLDVLGLEVQKQEPGLVQLGVGSSVLLELRQNASARAGSQREAGLFHTAFLLPSRADLAAWVGFAAQHRVEISGASDHLVSEAIYLADPEGNGIEIYADRPSSMWAKADGSIAMATEPLNFQDLARAGEGRSWSGFPAGVTVGHVHLQVGQLAPADAFYSDLLGFAITARYPGASFYGSGGYHHQLASNVWNSRGAGPRSDEATGLADVEIIVDAAVLDAVRSRLSPGAVHAQDPSRLSLRDPWGTSITLVGR